MTITHPAEPATGLRKPDVAEPLAYSVQQQGTAAGRECRVILVGLHTGKFYCAEHECTYVSQKWSSVFAHRSKHGKATAAQSVARVDSLRTQLATALIENSDLRSKLDGERARRREAEGQLNKIRRTVA